jgi:dTDP-4-amino-4,6-dideoxygalactose transaminase
MPDAHEHIAPIVLPSDQDITGRSLGQEEIAFLKEAVQSGTLTSTRGRFVRELERRFREMTGSAHGYACSSGTAAIHTAIAALDPEPGDEIITTAITDMGAITPILYQGAVPVFADIDATTGNVTAESVAERISERTRAIIVTHLFGNPAPVDAIAELARKRGIAVIEDCAQAFLAGIGGRPVGRFSDIACYSIQQGKHITAGEGGLVTTDDPKLARRMFLFINKAWGYGDSTPDHYFLALNYRMTELQGAVALAQIEKLADGVARRRAMAARLERALGGLAGIAAPRVLPNASHSYWRFALLVDGAAVPGGPVALGKGLKDHSIASSPRYIEKPAFQRQVIRDQRTFGSSRYPFTLARPQAVDYEPARYPGTFRFLEQVLVLPWNERYEERHVDFLADALRAQQRLLTRSGEARHG